MSNLDKYKGVIPAFYACYDDKGEVCAERTQKFTQYLIDKGVKGLYLTGSSGECIYQTIEERKKTVENVMKVAKGKITVISHIASPSTQHSIELAKHAESCGVDAIAAIPPIYFVLSETAVEKYWKDMADSVNLDFIIYNIPQTTQFALSVNLFKKMRENKKVIGVKNSSMPVMDITKFKMAGGKDCIVFNGPDEQFVSGLLAGAEGGIGGTYGVMPELFIAAQKAVQSGDFERAQKIQFAVTDIIFDLCSCQGNLYSVMKEILKINGMNIGKARLPLLPVTEADMNKVNECKTKIDAAIAQFCK